jgi:hypothetical protein
VGQDERDRRAFAGRILRPGRAIYDRYISQPNPTPNAKRSPVTYFSDPEFDRSRCRCGCGEETRSTWEPGHDQRAIHQVLRAGFGGSAAAFLDWYEGQRPGASA